MERNAGSIRTLQAAVAPCGGIKERQLIQYLLISTGHRVLGSQNSCSSRVLLGMEHGRMCCSKILSQGT